ncbi:transcriptional regulator LuxR [Legionella busanensis]|uniref:Transcriptional regulator LuxR n=1 Tax=Legionella busanensis TaxID=190655 RepID=A0A378JP04_9GAMM|nr:helix-turn-helix transcriptional regulator [Legionella busanensis]STX51710.1 transcriptional regulator LuxR [Legionella busanensis]
METLNHYLFKDFYLVKQIPGFLFIKDLQGRIVNASSDFIAATGYKTLRDVSGKTDFDLPWATHALEYLRWDQEVAKGYLLMNHLEQHCHANSSYFEVVVNKSPLTNAAGEIIGIIGLYTMSPQVKANDLLETNLQTIYGQQKKCLKYVIQGLSAKEIAKKMDLSHRTIEYYLQILRRKLACRNKAELIIKASRFLQTNEFE